MSQRLVKCQLQCMTGRIFIVDIEVLNKALIIKSMLEDLNIGKDPEIEVDEQVIPLPNLTERCMEKLIEWCTHHKNEPPPPETDEEFNFKDEIGEWDLEFLKMDDATLFDLILAANYLDIKGLLDIATTYVARIIAELRTPEEIRKRFNIKNDLTQKDLDEIKIEAEHWLEDDDEDTKPSAASSAPPRPTKVERSDPGADDPMAGPSSEGASGGEELLGAVGGFDPEQGTSGGAYGGGPSRERGRHLLPGVDYDDEDDD